MARKRPRGKSTEPKPRRLRSGYEGRVALALDKAGVDYTYETEKLIYVQPEKKKTYCPDFPLKTRSGKTIFLEAKGYFTPAMKSKMLLVIAQNPDKDIRMLFQANNWNTKKKTSRYSDWAEKHSIKYAVSPNGTVPISWLEE